MWSFFFFLSAGDAIKKSFSKENVAHQFKDLSYNERIRVGAATVCCTCFFLFDNTSNNEMITTLLKTYFVLSRLQHG